MTTISNPPVDLTHWLVRLLAYAIDSIIFGVVAVLILLVSKDMGITLVVWVVLSLLYFILLDVYWGATIGKNVMGLVVQTEKGGKVSLTQSFIRNISKIVFFPVFLDWIIAMVTSGEDPRQKFTDRIAKTTVIQTRQIVKSAKPAPPT